MARRVRTTRRLEVWLKDTSVALFVLNSQRRLVFFNHGCEQLTGWSPTEVLGQVCEFVSETDFASPAALLASLAPPGNVFRGETIAVPASVARREQEAVSSVIYYFPLTDHEQKVQAALGVIQPASLSLSAEQVSTSQRLHVELALLRNSIQQKSGQATVIGQCAGMRRVLNQLQLAQQSLLPVLFVGEPGTGREHMARIVHAAGQRGRELFVPLDCRHTPADFLESTFRRLHDARPGEGLLPGTIYLNQIETLTRDLQRDVLKLIQSNHDLAPRVMAASTKPLETVIESDQFLDELAFALTPLMVTVPALRNRPGDLEPLAQFFLEELNRGASIQVTEFQEAVWDKFRRYNWPGNVQELQTVIREARKECQGSRIELTDLPFRFRTGVAAQTIGPPRKKQIEPLDALLLRVEREQIETALAEARDNKAKAAELLGITRPRLYRRMEILGFVDPEAGPIDE